MRERTRDKGRLEDIRCQVDKYLAETDWETWQSENDCFDESDEIENINLK